MATQLDEQNTPKLQKEEEEVEKKEEVEEAEEVKVKETEVKEAENSDEQQTKEEEDQEPVVKEEEQQQEAPVEEDEEEELEEIIEEVEEEEEEEAIVEANKEQEAPIVKEIIQKNEEEEKSAKQEQVASEVQKPKTTEATTTTKIDAVNIVTENVKSSAITTTTTTTTTETANTSGDTAKTINDNKMNEEEKENEIKATTTTTTTTLTMANDELPIITIKDQEPPQQQQQQQQQQQLTEKEQVVENLNLSQVKNKEADEEEKQIKQQQQPPPQREDETTTTTAKDCVDATERYAQQQFPLTMATKTAYGKINWSTPTTTTIPSNNLTYQSQQQQQQQQQQQPAPLSYVPQQQQQQHQYQPQQQYSSSFYENEESSNVNKNVDLEKIFTPANDAEFISPKNRKLYASSAFYSPSLHPTVEDQVELARRISHSLSDISNHQSKGQSMYVNRKKRSVKWIHEGHGHGQGFNVETQQQEEEEEEEEAEEEEENGENTKLKYDKMPLKLIMNPRGQVRDIFSLKETINTEGLLSPEKCHELVMALENHKGKGAELFAKRRKKAENWIVEASSQSQSSSSTTTTTTTKLQQQHEKELCSNDIADYEANRRDFLQTSPNYRASTSPNLMPAYSEAGKHRVQLNLQQEQLLQKYVKPELRVVKTPWEAALETGSASTAFVEQTTTTSPPQLAISPQAAASLCYSPQPQRNVTPMPYYPKIQQQQVKPQQQYDNFNESKKFQLPKIEHQQFKSNNNNSNYLAYKPSVPQGWKSHTFNLPTVIELKLQQQNDERKCEEILKEFREKSIEKQQQQEELNQQQQHDNNNDDNDEIIEYENNYNNNNKQHQMCQQQQHDQQKLINNLGLNKHLVERQRHDENSVFIEHFVRSPELRSSPIPINNLWAYDRTVQQLNVQQKQQQQQQLQQQFVQEQQQLQQQQYEQQLQLQQQQQYEQQQQHHHHQFALKHQETHIDDEEHKNTTTTTTKTTCHDLLIAEELKYEKQQQCQQQSNQQKQQQLQQLRQSDEQEKEEDKLRKRKQKEEEEMEREKQEYVKIAVGELINAFEKHAQVQQQEKQQQQMKLQQQLTMDKMSCENYQHHQQQLPFSYEAQQQQQHDNSFTNNNNNNNLQENLTDLFRPKDIPLESYAPPPAMPDVLTMKNNESGGNQAYYPKSQSINDSQPTAYPYHPKQQGNDLKPKQQYLPPSSYQKVGKPINSPLAPVNFSPSPLPQQTLAKFEEPASKTNKPRYLATSSPQKQFERAATPSKSLRILADAPNYNNAAKGWQKPQMPSNRHYDAPACRPKPNWMASQLSSSMPYTDF